MSTKFRSLTPTEKKILKDYSAGSFIREGLAAFGWAFPLIAGFLFMLIFGAVRFVGPSLGVDNVFAYKIPIVWFSVVVSGSYVCFHLVSFFAEARELSTSAFHHAVNTDLNEGVAAVENYIVTNAIEISGYEDEGAGFFLVLEDGRVLCLIGQDLDPYAHDSEAEPDEGIEDERHLFPQTTIEYTYAPKSGIRLDVKGIGDPLRPRSIVETNEAHFPRSGCGPQSDEFYEGPIENVLLEFGYVKVELESKYY